MKQFKENSYLFASNAPFVEELYAEFLKKPTSVSADWQNYFTEMQGQNPEKNRDIDHKQVRDEFVRLSAGTRSPAAPLAEPLSSTAETKQVQVLQLINAYRFMGHQNANFDPLSLRPKPLVPELGLDYHHLSEDDLDLVFNTGSFSGPRQAKLGEILGTLRRTYCGHIGAEYMHITDTEEKRWLQQRLESVHSTPSLSAEKKINILNHTIAASEFEKYLHTRYVGQKRFSLEGAESLIPVLDELVQRSGHHKVTEIVLGMAHRGRLNVLTNILGKAPNMLFKEFEGEVDTHENGGSGDVKYHQGFSSDILTSGGIVHLALLFNPSHLEIISPVVEGSVRARQNRRGDDTGDLVLPVLIHGDAAFAGQGVVMETFQMSEARGFTTGGTVHIIINNQIGFTTSNPLDARSTVYCTEVARMVQAPIFHVNGDDPEAVNFVTKIALDYRMQFKKDVVIDMVCFRRHGHSEADEPSATQPMMYKKIKSHGNMGEMYAKKLIEQGVVNADYVVDAVQTYRSKLGAGECVAPNIVTETFDKPYWVDWKPYAISSEIADVDTTISKSDVQNIMAKLCKVPDGFAAHSQVVRIFKGRRAMAEDEKPMDWGFTETLAYATLLQSGYPVRLSGQDCGRGTFFHRHAIIHDQHNGNSYAPLQHLSPKQAQFVAIDSLLSEEAVLGFEYGYSTAAPYSLVIWEAQFGDFANGAQVVIDQFISSGESKWGRLSGLVLFLPHGFDGQGPEHSSARLERYLQLCAEENIQVCMPSLPAQMFHLLRRQMLRDLRRPLVIMTPKNLLRHKLSTSSLYDLCHSGFRQVIGEIDKKTIKKVRKLVICSGKVYFDLLDARRERNINNIAILRIEQFYPFPEAILKKKMNVYKDAKEIVWCQEEPLNQGAWTYISPFLRRSLKTGQKMRVVARPESASPAVGYFKKHIDQLQNLVDEALS